MATVSLLNVDEEGNILSPKVLARLSGLFGSGGSGGAGSGITGSTTLDQAASQTTDGA